MRGLQIVFMIGMTIGIAIGLWGPEIVGKLVVKALKRRAAR